MSEEGKVKYETTTPVEGDYKEHALSKFQKFHEEQRESMYDLLFGIQGGLSLSLNIRKHSVS